MAVNISKVEKLTGSSGPISFSQIKDEFGGNTTNIRASLYRRNDGDNVDWDGPNASKIEPKIPDATENQDIGSKNNWNVSALRNTVMEYNVTQSGSNEELVYFDSDTSTWNGNLNRNVLKKFDVTGTIFANQINKDALTFGGDLYNLEIEVDGTGKIYGEGGSIGSGAGGDALYVNNTRTNSPVEIYSYGQIYAGGGGGASGNPGNSGSSLSCSSTSYYNANNPFRSGTNLSDARPGQTCRRARSGGRWVSANQSGIRNRCRGGGTRRGSGDYPGGNYQCSSSWNVLCVRTNSYNLGGGNGGNGGSGGRGRGFSYQSGSLSGNSGNSGNSNSCSGGTSTGNRGNSGTSGGDWGQSGGSGASAGIAIQKKNAVMKSYTSNTVKGRIVDI
jgi:hypothetical protein